MINTHPRRLKVKTLGMEYNDDLLTEILLRLPVKSLTRLKSVCKKWVSIISSDHFCHQHTLRLPKLQPSLILQLGLWEFFYLNPTTNGEKKMIPYSMMSVPIRNCIIVQACNGLMLMKFDKSNEGLIYYVYNLTTRRSRKIALTHNDGYPRFAGIGLAFDPSKSPYYKIVCIYRSNPNQNPSSYDPLTKYQIEVYDSESQSWKLRLEASVPKLYSDRGTHWNNKIYWWSSCGYCYFDIDKNEMKTLSFTPNAYNGGLRPDLLESNGHLYHCVYESKESVGLWELVGNIDDGPSPWLFKHRALIRGSTTNILGFMAGSDGDETCSLLQTLGDRKIRVYSFRDEIHEDLIDLTTQPCYQPKNGCFYISGCFQFGETLALV